MKINIFGKLLSKNDNKVKVEDKYVAIDLNAYNKENMVTVARPSLYNFDSFVEDLDRVSNPKPLKNTEFIEI